MRWNHKFGLETWKNIETHKMESVKVKLIENQKLLPRKNKIIMRLTNHENELRDRNQAFNNIL